MANNDNIGAAGFNLSYGTPRKKKRMVRQRRTNIDILSLPFAKSSPSSSSTGSSSSLQMTEPSNLRFLLQKELRRSDVGPLGRILLPKRASEMYLPTLDTKEAVMINMEDIDDTRGWNFKYRFWHNNGGRMYLIEHTGEFVKTHDLQVGDFLMIYKDEYTKKYVIRARKALDLNVCCEKKVLLDDCVPSISDSEGKEESNLFRVPELDLFPFDVNTYPDLNLPDVNIPVDVSNFSSLGPLTSFGSLDNFFLDDFEIIQTV